MENTSSETSQPGPPRHMLYLAHIVQGRRPKSNISLPRDLLKRRLVDELAKERVQISEIDEHILPFGYDSSIWGLQACLLRALELACKRVCAKTFEWQQKSQRGRVFCHFFIHTNNTNDGYLYNHLSLWGNMYNKIFNAHITLTVISRGATDLEKLMGADVREICLERDRVLHVLKKMGSPPRAFQVLALVTRCSTKSGRQTSRPTSILAVSLKRFVILPPYPEVQLLQYIFQYPYPNSRGYPLPTSNPQGDHTNPGSQGRGLERRPRRKRANFDLLRKDLLRQQFTRVSGLRREQMLRTMAAVHQERTPWNSLPAATQNVQALPCGVVSQTSGDNGNLQTSERGLKRKRSEFEDPTVDSVEGVPERPRKKLRRTRTHTKHHKRH